MHGYFVCLYVCVTTYMLCPWRLENCVRTGVTDGCKLACRCWEPDMGLQEEQAVLSNTEPSPAPHCLFLIPCPFLTVEGAQPFFGLHKLVKFS